MPACAFDFMIGIEKRQCKPRAETASDGRFARSHHADKHNRAAAQRRDNLGLMGRAVLMSVPRSRSSSKALCRPLGCRAESHLYYSCGYRR